MAKIKIKMVPVQGKSHIVEVDATHTTVSAALKAAGLSTAAGFLYSVNGEPADLNRAVAESDTVTVTEKVKGS